MLAAGVALSLVLGSLAQPAVAGAPLFGNAAKAREENALIEEQLRQMELALEQQQAAKKAALGGT